MKLRRMIIWGEFALSMLQRLGSVFCPTQQRRRQRSASPTVSSSTSSPAKSPSSRSSSDTPTRRVSSYASDMSLLCAASLARPFGSSRVSRSFAGSIRIPSLASHFGWYTILLASILAISASISTAHDLAPFSLNNCGDHEQLIQGLESLGEERIWLGRLPNGWVLQLYGEPRGITWSLLLTQHDMGTCVIGAGIDWRSGDGDV